MHRLRVPALVMLAAVGGCTAVRTPAPAPMPSPIASVTTPSAPAATPAPVLPATPASTSAPTSGATTGPSAPIAQPAAPASPARRAAAPAAAPKVVAPTRVPAAAGPTPTPPPAAVANPSAPSLDLHALEQRLRDTHAIGVFTKLSLKNQVDTLLEQFRAKHKGASIPTLAELRQRYDLLLLKVLSLLQDADPTLAQAITTSREAIWGILTDPREFAKI